MKWSSALIISLSSTIFSYCHNLSTSSIIAQNHCQEPSGQRSPLESKSHSEWFQRQWSVCIVKWNDSKKVTGGGCSTMGWIELKWDDQNDLYAGSCYTMIRSKSPSIGRDGSCSPHLPISLPVQLTVYIRLNVDAMYFCSHHYISTQLIERFIKATWVTSLSRTLFHFTLKFQEVNLLHNKDATTDTSERNVLKRDFMQIAFWFNHHVTSSILWHHLLD